MQLDFHKGLVTGDRPGAGAAEEQGAVFGRARAAGLPPLLPERDQWAEREREMERREKARAEREWDRDKVREFGKPDDEKEGARRSRSRERRRKERGKSKEKKSEKKGTSTSRLAFGCLSCDLVALSGFTLNSKATAQALIFCLLCRET